MTDDLIIAVVCRMAGVAHAVVFDAGSTTVSPVRPDQRGRLSLKLPLGAALFLG